MPTSRKSSAPPDLIRRFKEELIERGYSTRTADVYATAVSSFLKSIPEADSPTGDAANDYIRAILDGTAKSGTSQSSVGIAASALKLFFKHTVGEPLELKVELKRRARPMPTILSREEIQKIVGVTRNVSHRLIFQLMYSSGLKLDELLALNPDQLR